MNNGQHTKQTPAHEPERPSRQSVLSRPSLGAAWTWVVLCCTIGFGSGCTAVLGMDRDYKQADSLGGAGSGAGGIATNSPGGGGSDSGGNNADAAAAGGDGGNGTGMGDDSGTGGAGTGSSGSPGDAGSNALVDSSAADHIESIDSGAGGLGDAGGDGEASADGACPADAGADGPSAADVGTDAGCSESVVLQGETATPLAGAEGNALFEDVCPLHQVLIGYSGTLRNDIYVTENYDPVVQVASLTAVCGTLSISQTGDVTVSRQGTLVQQGSTTDGEWTQMCPTNQVVVGIRGRSGAVIDAIGFVCASLTSTRSSDGASLELGSRQALAFAGGDGGTEFDLGCPEGMVAHGQNGYVAIEPRPYPQWLTALGFQCSTPVPATECVR